MSFLKTDSSQAGGFAPIKPGKYEAVITEVKKDKAKSSGSDLLKVTLTIRSNVDQEFKKRKVFDNLVVSEKAMFRFHQVSTACGFPQGHEFDSLDDFAKAIRNQCVAITIKNEPYEGKVQDKVSMYQASEYPIQSNEDYEEAMGGSDEPIEINDDDLPF